MVTEEASVLISALRPVLSRVNTAVTAIKTPDGSRWTREMLNHARMVAHVSGATPRGCCPIKQGESTVRLALLDLDSHKGEVSWDGMTEVATKVMDALELCGFAPVPWRSSGGSGIHIFLIWDDPQDAYSVREALREVLDMVGYRDGAKGIVNKQIEIFPKQNAVGEGEFGNQFILPLAGKSEPLDAAFGLMPMGRDFAPLVDWRVSEPVERRAQPETPRTIGEAGCEPLERIRAALAVIPNDGGPDSPDYDRWRDLCFAVHEAGGGSDEALEIFETWSAQNPRHDGKFLRERVWRYVRGAGNRQGGGVTRGTLFAAAVAHGWVDTVGMDTEGFEDVSAEDVQQVVAVVKAERAEDARRKIDAKSGLEKAIREAGDEGALRADVCPKIAANRLIDQLDRDMLADALKRRFQELGQRVGIAACRKMIAPPKSRERVAGSDPTHWSNGWVYVTDLDQFHQLGTEVFVSMQGFNAMFNRFLPPPEEGSIPLTAGRIALDHERIPTVTRCAYMPHLNTTFSVDGIEYANLFRESSLPATAKNYTPEGLEAIKRVEQHTRLLAGGREDVARTLLDWCAHNVQYPGKKIRWCPVIKGIEGDGKSFFGRLIRGALGQANVRDISVKAIGTDFNAWAHGACVGVLEEIRIVGHNRHDILNALKPNITNDTVAIHAKGRDEINVWNTMNYIAFTNFADALPLSDTDRRYWVVFTPFSTIAQFEKEIGKDPADYFGDLFDGIELHREEIRKWMLERKIHPSFDPNGRAPMTEEKRSMIAMSISPEEDALALAIEKGGVGVGPSVLVVSKLRELARTIDPDAHIDQRTVARLLQKMGWRNHHEYVKWRGDKVRVWYRPDLILGHKENFRVALNETCKEVEGIL